MHMAFQAYNRKMSRFNELTAVYMQNKVPVYTGWLPPVVLFRKDDSAGNVLYSARIFSMINMKYISLMWSIVFPGRVALSFAQCPPVGEFLRVPDPWVGQVTVWRRRPGAGTMSRHGMPISRQ